MANSGSISEAVRPPFWRDVKVLRVVAQLVAVVGAAAFLWFLGSNLTTNLTSQGIPTDFEFLNQPAGVTVPGTDFKSSQPISDILVQGIKNTFALVIVGIPLLTILGTLVGIGRLSSNWLVRKAATAYVETLRNIPPLLVIVFTNTAVILASLPRIQEAWQPFDLFVFSNRGLVFPWFTPENGSGAYLGVLGVGVIASIVVWIWRTRQFDATGTPHHRFLWGTGVFLLFAVIGFLFIGSPYSLSRPVLNGLVVTGGLTRISGYVAVLLALVIYTASHVAEIVRGSIQAVVNSTIRVISPPDLTQIC